MLLRGSAFALALVALTACSSTSPKGEPTAPTSAAPTTPTSTPGTSGPANPPASAEPTTAPPGGPAPPALAGRWTSPKCGARGYVRNLDLIDGGRFKSEDRVSPCPPKVACVWSGIVNREGAWVDEGKSVKLTVDTDGNGPGASALPATLERSGAELVEVQGGERCSYTKP